MNFALIGSIFWLATTPDKEGADNYPGENLINGAVYVIENEVDATVLHAWDPGLPGYRPGYVNTTKFRVVPSTTWSLQYFKDHRFLTIRSQSQNNTHNELALIVEHPDGKRPETYNRYWNITFVGRTLGVDKWQIMDFGKGTPTPNGASPKCLQSQQWTPTRETEDETPPKSLRTQLGDCDKLNRKQRWRFCLCSLPPLPKGHTERDRVIERIPA